MVKYLRIWEGGDIIEVDYNEETKEYFRLSLCQILRVEALVVESNQPGESFTTDISVHRLTEMRKSSESDDIWEPVERGQ